MERNIKFEDGNLSLAIEEIRTYNTIAIRFHQFDENNIIWNTDIVVNFDTHIFSIKIDRETTADTIGFIPQFKTPILVNMLLDRDQGNESVKATATELKRLVLRGRNTSYDSKISNYRVEDFAFSKLRERYKKWTGNSFDEKDLVSFGLTNEQGYLTNAGALIADESPIRHSRLFCTRWNGLNKNGGTVEAFDDAEYSAVYFHYLIMEKHLLREMRR